MAKPPTVNIHNPCTDRAQCWRLQTYAWALAGMDLPQYARSRTLGRAVGYEVRRAVHAWHAKMAGAVTG